mgnify:CR=1 FL=1
MNITGIIIAAAVVGIVGIVIGILLGIASEKFKVEVDEREILVRAELPGNNCGGCGYPGCGGLAAAIAAGKAPVNRLSGRRQRSGKSHCSYHGRRDKRRTPHDSLCKMCRRL